MVRLLTLFLSLWSGAAFAQGSLVTPAVSPWNVIDVQGTSPWAVNGNVAVSGTATVSPTGTLPVNCLSGCASAGASPSSSIVTSGTTYAIQGTSPWAINGAVTVNGTTTVSLTAGLPTLTVSPVAGTYVVSPSTSPWAVTVGTVTTSAVAGGNQAVTVTGTVTTSPTAGTYIVSPSTSPWAVTVGTVTTSEVAGGNRAVTVTNTVTSSLTNATTVTASLTNATTVTASLAAGGNQAVTVTGTVTTSPTAGTYPVNVVAASASPFSVIEQNATAYPNKANFVAGSKVTSATTSQILLNQGTGTNKLYVTGIQCMRTDTTTAAVYIGLNGTLTNGTSTYIGIPSASATGVGNAGVNNVTFNPPLVVAASTSLQFTPSAAVTDIRCNAQGYQGP